MDRSFRASEWVVVVDRGTGRVRERTPNGYIVELADGDVLVSLGDAPALLRSPIDIETARILAARIGERTKGRGDLPKLTSRRAFARAPVALQAEYLRVAYASPKSLEPLEREAIGSAEALLISELSVVLGVAADPLRTALKKGKPLPAVSSPESHPGDELARTLELLASTDAREVQEGLGLVADTRNARVVEALLAGLPRLRAGRSRLRLYVAAQTIGQLGRSGDRRAAGAIMDFVGSYQPDDEDAQVEEAACEALVNLGAKEAIPFLHEALHSTRWEFQESAVVDALVALGGTEELDFLTAALTSEKQAIVVCALDALATFRDPVTLPAIEPLTTSKAEEIRTRAWRAIAILDPERSVDAVRAWGALSTNASRRAAAVAFAGELARPEVAPLLVEKLNDPAWTEDRSVRFAILETLLALGFSEARALVERVRNSDESPWTKALASSLLLVDRSGAELVLELVDFVRRFSEHADERDAWWWSNSAAEAILRRLDDATRGQPTRVAFLDVANDIRREHIKGPNASVQQLAGAIVKREVGSDRYVDFEGWKAAQQG